MAAGDYRGAVRPPFIEAGQGGDAVEEKTTYRGAVRPPFIEALAGGLCHSPAAASIGGQSAPPSLKHQTGRCTPTCKELSGGSPPPLH